MNLPAGCPFAPRCPYAKDICHEKLPEHYTTETGHYSACHFAGDDDFVKNNAPDTSRSRGTIATGTPDVLDPSVIGGRA